MGYLMANRLVKEVSFHMPVHPYQKIAVVLSLGLGLAPGAGN
jgi:hypothetical protein